MWGNPIFPVLGGGTITSGFGSRASPGGIGSTNHRGIDIGGKTGTPIVAPVAGTVIGSSFMRGYGNTVDVRDAQGFTHRFAHLDSRSVTRGMNLSAGQVIGALGSTGNSTGPHLHYEIRDALGKAVNPRGLLDQAKTTLKGAIGNALGTGLKAGASAIPGGSLIVGAVEGAGLLDGCGPICQVQNWIKDSGFFQRLALAIFAFILLIGAVYMMKGNLISQVAGKMKKGF